MIVSYEDVTPSRPQKHPVSITSIQWNTERRTMAIREVTVTLTPTEYHILFPLRYGIPITYADLARTVYNCAVDEKVRVMMDKHIDRIRGKLRGTGVYVYCVLTYGYLLFNESFLEEEEQYSLYGGTKRTL
jgi:DNA-binding response OmpR family regulator